MNHGKAATLVAVVVTHNRLEQLRLTVARLLAEDIDRLVVVDNASTDETAAFLDGVSDPRLVRLRLVGNLGGAGGFEAGLRHAVAAFDPDWCVVMDDDARPQPGALARFRAEAGNFAAQGYEAVAAGVYYPDGQICEMNRPSRNPFWNLGSFVRTLLGGGRAGFHVSDADYDQTRMVPIDVASFVGLCLSRAAVARVGFPHGGLFLYGDDVIYTLRLSRAGGAIGFAPWLRFDHDCTTFRQGGGHIHRPMWKVYYNYRNGLLAYREAAGPVLFWPALLIMLVKWRLKARHYGTDKGLYLRLLGLAVGDGLRRKLDRSHAEVMARAAGATGDRA